MKLLRELRAGGYLWPLVIFLLLLAFLAAEAKAAEPPRAGKFWREGMKGMYEIGLRMPLEGNASMRILGCSVHPQHATCRLEIRQQGTPTCRVRINLRHRRISYPARSWHCPAEWRPVPISHPDLQGGQQLKALDPVQL